MTTLRWKVLAVVAVLVAAVYAFTPPSEKVRLGLDLKGGVHLVLRVQTDDALRIETETVADRFREQMKMRGVAGMVAAAASDRFRVEGVPADGLRLGTRYMTEMRFMAFRTHVAGEVLEWDPPQLSVIRLKGLLDATVTSVVEELSGGRSLLEHTIDYRFRGGPLGELAARSLARMGGADLALRHGSLAQKREIEERFRRAGGSSG